MHRIHDPDLTVRLDAGETAWTLEGNEARHALRVKRLGPGDRVEIFDARGRIAVGCLGESDGRRAVIRIEDARLEPPLRPPLILAVPPVKGPRCDRMVDDLGQIGATGWIPLRSERTVVRVRANRLENWRRATIETVRQCGRAHALVIEDPAPLDVLLASPGWRRAAASNRLLVADFDGIGPGARRAALREGDEPIVLAVGPEGGWSEAERDAFRAAGASAVRLGPHVLRTETAALVGAALLRG